MSPVSTFVDTAFRLLVVTELTARYLALCTLIVGLVGYWTAGSSTRRSTRFRSMIVGSIAALVVIFGLTAFHDAVAYVMAGSTVLPPDWPYGAAGAGSLLPLAQAAAGTLSYLGLACISLGAALWAVGRPAGRIRTRGYRGVTYGLVMIAVSMGGSLFTVFATVFTSL
jgi:CDP-diglyceride synthetase